jgi:hypothetical protein
MTWSLGCDVCREGAYAGGQPVLVASAHANSLLYRCGVCHTWWLGDGRVMYPVTPEQARGDFPAEVGAAPQR